jgi:hypothetical protein
MGHKLCLTWIRHVRRNWDVVRIRKVVRRSKRELISTVHKIRHHNSLHGLDKGTVWVSSIFEFMVL